MIPEDTTKKELVDVPAPEQRPQPAAPTPKPEAVAQPAQRKAAPSGGHDVVLDDLHAYYGEQHSVKGVSITFPANEVTALIGPSGSGKSTVVRCINRMHEELPGARATGKVTLDDVDVYDPSIDITAVRRLIGMVFQKPNPFPTMSIFDNVAAGMKLTGTKGGDLKERVHRALRSVGLWDEVKDRLRSSATQLSGGQQQRLCIARAIAAQPEVILMDEPCSALDPVATLRIEDLMQELKADYTIVIVTHNMQQAARVSDMTAFFTAEVDATVDRRAGVLVEFDRTEKMFTSPSDARTESYVSGRFG